MRRIIDLAALALVALLAGCASVAPTGTPADPALEAQGTPSPQARTSIPSFIPSGPLQAITPAGGGALMAARLAGRHPE